MKYFPKLTVLLSVAFIFALSCGDARGALADASTQTKPSAEAKANAASGEQRLYLAAGNQLAVYRIDSASGALKAMQALPLAGAGPFTFSPNGKRMYAAANMKTDAGNSSAIATLDVQPDGQLKLAHIAAINLRPGYLKTDSNGAYLAGNHYGPGKATIWKLSEGVYRGQTVQELSLEQKAHSAVFSPDNQWLLVPATGPNKVFVIRFDAQTGAAKPNEPPFASGPQGEQDARQPRHLIFHPTRPMIYTTNEREQPGVGVWTWNAKRGTLKTVQNIATLPTGFKGFISTADLHMTRDGRYLYLSNRDSTDRKAKTGRDSIVGFKVDAETGRLTMIGHTPCERVPRSFTLDASDRYVYVAGQADNRLGAYRIDSNSGQLTKIEQHEVGTRPIWVETLLLPGR